MGPEFFSAGVGPKGPAFERFPDIKKKKKKKETHFFSQSFYTFTNEMK
jgi:hypothetical protein